MVGTQPLPPGQLVEQVLHVVRGDVVERPLGPVGEIAGELRTLETVGAGRLVVVGGHEDLEGPLQDQQAARPCALNRPFRFPLLAG